MTAAFAALLAAAAGAALGWVGARRASAGRLGGVEPALLPDPALDWLRRAHGASGAWVFARDGALVARAGDGGREAVRRLDRPRADGTDGVERLDDGTLLYRSGHGLTAAVLVPAGRAPATIAAAERDLRALLDGLAQRPQFEALREATREGRVVESVGSVGLRLAFELERHTQAEVLVAAVRDGVPVVIGVSASSDRRLLDRPIDPASPLGRGALRGDETDAADDPTGGLTADRRGRGPRWCIRALRDEADTVAGAVAVAGGPPRGLAAALVARSVAAAARRLLVSLETERLANAATRDPLTGLLNRRGFDEALAVAPVGALVACDIDRFKSLNDTLGHAAGDAALQHVARVLQGALRPRDRAGRVGGEEFQVWLPETGLEEAVRVAERLRAALAAGDWRWQGQPWPLTASFGVASVPETAPAQALLFDQADRALYAAKRGGRDRVVAAA